MSGVLNSVNTNVSAMIALQSLNQTTARLNNVQNIVSTGYIVSNAVDNGAAFAVAQTIRANIAAMITANQQLGNTNGLLSVTNSALKSVSDLMADVKSQLVNLSNSSISLSSRQEYSKKLQSDLNNIKTDLLGASYNGRTLLNGASNLIANSGTGTHVLSGPAGASSATTGAVSVIENSMGDSFSISQFSACAFFSGLSTMLSTITLKGKIFTNSTDAASMQKSAASAAVALVSTFGTLMDDLGTAMNYFGTTTSYVSNQITYNTDQIDAVQQGLGSLVDADMAKESSLLQSLQVKQQLAVSALSIADSAPSILTKLF